MTAFFDYRQGSSPLIVSFPHVGTYVPPHFAARMTEAGKAVADTDWHVHLLYDFLDEFDATNIVATHSRYIADLNRDPDGAKLYPGRFETGVCPRTSFAGEPVWTAEPPDEEARVETYWRPYHAKLREALDRAVARHGHALLIDAHSILSHVPTLFNGKLPDLNLGTDDGKSCAPALQQAAMESFVAQTRFTSVANGRFKGGHITRHYGDPARGIHTLQLEMAMSAYLDEASPREFDSARAKPLRDVLHRFAGALVKALPAAARSAP